MNVVEIIKEILTKSNGMFSAKKPLVEAFGAENVDFVAQDMPVPFHIIVKHASKRYAIINKAYADAPDMVCGELAIGALD